MERIIPKVVTRTLVIIIVLSNVQFSVNVAGQYNGENNKLPESDCRYSAKPLRSVPATDLYRLGRDLMADSGRTDPQLPCWFDPNLARVGQRFARTNFAQLVIAHFLSLFLLLANPDIRRILYFTMRSGDPENAYKRYIATALHAKLWYDVDILHANLSTSVRKVRNIHRGTAFRIEDENLDFTRPLVEPGKNPNGFEPRRDMWEAFRRDVEESLPMLGLKPGKLVRDRPKYFFNQYLMSVTQWSFMALPLLHTNPLAFVFVSEHDLKGFAHLWAGLAYMLGMDENYILCKDQNLLECYRYTKVMEREYFLSYLYEIDYEAEIMLESLLRVSVITAVKLNISEQSPLRKNVMLCRNSLKNLEASAT